MYVDATTTNALRRPTSEPHGLNFRLPSPKKIAARPRALGGGGGGWCSARPRLLLFYDKLGNVFRDKCGQGVSGPPSPPHPSFSAGRPGEERGGPGFPSLQRGSPLGPRPYGSRRKAGAAKTWPSPKGFGIIAPAVTGLPLTALSTKTTTSFPLRR